MTGWWRNRLFLLALVVFAGGVAGILLTASSPGHGAGPAGPPAAGPVTRPADPVMEPEVHASQARRAEIDQRFKEAVVMLHAGRYDDAATALHRLLELAPDMPEANVNMGFAMIGLKRYDIARDFFQTAINLRPMQANAYYGLAESLEGLKDLEGALGAMRTYVHLSSNADPFVRKARAAIWEWQAALAKKPAGAARRSREDGGKNPENGK